MKEVDELVEWAAKIFGEDYYDNKDWADYDALTREMFRKVAIKALSHPDLALIVRGESKWVEDVFGLHTDYEITYIPLADALKEADNE